MFELLFAESVALFFELFSDEGPVPSLGVIQAQMFCCKSAQIGDVFLGVRACAMSQVTQEVHNFRRRLCHFGYHRNFAKIGVPQQLCFFTAQCEDLADERGVVEFAAIALGLLRGSGDIGPVQLFAQVAAGGKLHHRQITRHLERELVACFALGLRSRLGRLLHVGRHAIQLIGRGVVGIGVGGIQCVFAELLAQLCLALLDLSEALFAGSGQLGAAEHKVAHRVQMRLALFWRERCGVDRFVFGVEPFIGTQACPEFGDAGQGGVVGSAQFGGVGHAVQVADCAPRAA